MEHAEAARRLDEYQAGRMDRESVRAFHAHLKGCEECRSLIRIRGAGQRSRRAAGLEGGLPPELRARMAGNRALLWRLVFAVLLAALLLRLWP